MTPRLEHMFSWGCPKSMPVTIKSPKNYWDWFQEPPSSPCQIKKTLWILFMIGKSRHISNTIKWWTDKSNVPIHSWDKRVSKLCATREGWSSGIALVPQALLGVIPDCSPKTKQKLGLQQPPMWMDREHCAECQPLSPMSICLISRNGLEEMKLERFGRYPSGDVGFEEWQLRNVECPSGDLKTL